MLVLRPSLLLSKAVGALAVHLTQSVALAFVPLKHAANPQSRHELLDIRHVTLLGDGARARTVRAREAVLQ